MQCNFKQAGTGPSRRHMQGSKIAKVLPSVNLQYSKIVKPKKVDCALKGGTLLKLSTFLLQLKGDPLTKKQNFEKKSHIAEKQKGGPFGIFKHPFCCKISKNFNGGPFGEKKN